MDKIMLIKIDRNLDTSLYIQIADCIKDLIDNNIYVADDKLPAIRILSDKLNVNNVTIVSAYNLLSEKKITYKIRGSGSYVTPEIDILNAPVEKLENAGNKINKLRDVHIDVSENMINFATATPKASLFPVEDFKAAINFVLDRDMGEAFGYQEAKGYLPLRKSISSYLKKVGIDTNYYEIQIISGAQQGLDIVSKAVLKYGDVVIVEAPTYSGAIASFRSRGVKIVQIPIGVDGPDMNKLENLIKRFSPKLMYTMINCQNPTGYSYSNKKKNRLLNFAKQYNMYILEDDYVGELIYTKQKTQPIKAIDLDDKVIYIKSFSKIFMPGLRLGFMVVPKKLNDDIEIAKQATDISTSGLIQRAFDIYLRDGDWEKQLKNMKTIYSLRYEKMKETLNKYLPRRVNYYVPKGGILFWIELPKGFDSRLFYDSIKDSKIIIVPGDLFYYSIEVSSGIRLSIASVNLKEIEEGIMYLSKYIKKFIEDTEQVNEKLPIL